MVDFLPFWLLRGVLLIIFKENFVVYSGLAWFWLLTTPTLPHLSHLALDKHVDNYVGPVGLSYMTVSAHIPANHLNPFMESVRLSR